MEHLEKKFEKANELLKIQGQKGNYDCDEYMRGLYNGMELILALFEDRTPVYKESEDEANDKR